MPVEIGGQVFAQRNDDVLLRCDNCGEKLVRELATDGTIVKARRRCCSCGIVYFGQPTAGGMLILAGIETMNRAVRTYS